MLRKILSLILSVLMIGTVFSPMGVSAESAEMRVFYDICHSLDNIWSSTNIHVVDDVIGEANYNNGGKMIGMIEADYKGFEIVYKVPEGRKFNSFFFEVSYQDLNTSNLAKIAYSENGTSYTDFTFGWTSGSTPGSGQNDAGWARINTAKVTAPENTDIRFIKIYHEGAAMTNTKKFYLRKASMLTTGGEIAEDEVVDELTGDDAEVYDISNLDVYNVVNSTEAKNIATVPDKFTDSNLIGIVDKSKDSYMVYKAGENRVFGEVDVRTLEKDTGGGVTVEIYGSADGESYDLISNTGVNIMERIHTNPDATADYGWIGWISLRSIKTTIPADKACKYIKLFIKGGTAGTTRLSSVNLSTVDMSKGCITGDVYEEQFDREMYNILESKNAEADGSSLSVTGDGYVLYKTLPAREMKKIELNADNDDIVLEAMDINKNKIIWNTEITETESGGSVVISSDVPDGAAYVKISGEAVYTGITIETADATGSEWTYIDGEPSFSAELAGEAIDTLKSGCTVSFSIPVKNAGSEQQSAKAYLCIFEGDRMDKIEEFDATVGAGGRVTVSGSTDIETVTDKTSVTVFLWTDLDSMIALGTEHSIAGK